MNPNKTKDFDLRQAHSVVYQRSQRTRTVNTLVGANFRLLLFLVLISNLAAQDRKVDATWLHRYVPSLSETKTELSSATCHYKPIFGLGDPDDRILRSVSRFAEVSVNAQGRCENVLFDREEEIDFVLQGTGILQYGGETHPLRANDFVYLAPGIKHSIANNSSQPLQVV